MSMSSCDVFLTVFWLGFRVPNAAVPGGPILQSLTCRVDAGRARSQRTSTTSCTLPVVSGLLVHGQRCVCENPCSTGNVQGTMTQTTVCECSVQTQCCFPNVSRSRLVECTDTEPMGRECPLPTLGWVTADFCLSPCTAGTEGLEQAAHLLR